MSSVFADAPMGGNPRDTSLNSRERHYLPFTIRVASSDRDFADAISLRAQAYARHNAPALDRVRNGEPDDERDDVVLLIARSKLDDGVVGTMRLDPNLRSPLHIASVITLPEPYGSARCVEFMRLGVRNGSSGRLVSAALAKAGYEICVAMNVEYIFLCSRSPVDTLYRGYRFDDLLNGKKLDLPYAPGAPHFVLCLPVADAEVRWQRHSESVYRFFVQTEHPDIRIDYATVERRFTATDPSSGQRVTPSSALAKKLVTAG
jgi:hypothetical protein